ncbi:MAG: InlB B-repeat-containing protein [Clostridia bacterium]|nr:InlB B-repeat-containing protein [Clostridia bacterium]
MKLFKRTLSVFLAVLMIFSSFSVLSSAVLGDGNENSVKITTKYFRQVGTDWVETSKVAEGDKIKARVFLETDYAAGGGEYFIFYPKNFLELDMETYADYEVGENQYELLVNPDYPYVVNDNYAGWFAPGEGNVDYAADLVDYGYIDASEIDKYNWIYVAHDTGSKARIHNVDDWFFEFDFIVKKEDKANNIKGAEGNGFIYFNENAFQTPVRDWSVGYITRQPSGDGGSFNRKVEFGFNVEFDFDFETPIYDFAKTYNVDGEEDANGTYGKTVDGKLVELATTAKKYNSDGVETADGTYAMTVDGRLISLDDIDTVNNAAETQKDVEAARVLSTKNAIVFDAGKGEFADGTTTAVAEGKIKSTIAAADIPADPSADKMLFVGWVPSTVENPTEEDVVDVTKAAYDYDIVTYNALYESASGTYVLNTYVMDTNGAYGAADKTNPPATVGQTANYDTSKIPAGFTLDTSKENVLSTKVTSDDTDVMTVYLKRNQYQATFGDAEPVDVYYEAAINAPDETPAKSGYTFAGWVLEGTDKVLTFPQTMGTEDVAYTATFAPAANTATIVINYVDKVTGEAKAVEMEVATTTENTIAVVETAGTDENTTYVTYAQIDAFVDSLTGEAADANPNIEHYEFTAEGSELSTTVAADGSTTLNVNYVPVSYTATFTGAVENETITEPYYTEITAPAAPPVEGQTFEGWTVNGTDVVVKAGDTFKLEGNATYTAKYSAANYTITYVYEGDAPAGVAVPDQVTDAHMGDAVDLSHAPTADGWTFDGWTVSGAVEDGDAYKVGTAPVTVTGKWIKNTYTIKFWLDEAKTQQYGETLVYSYGDMVEFPADPEDSDLPEAGTYFDFWDGETIDEIDNAVIYDDEGNLLYFTEVSKGNYVYELVAQTADYEYTVTFICANPSGGFATTKLEGLYYGDTVTADDIPSTDLDGYTFDYWMIGSQKVTEWADYEVTGSVQVRAYFTINSYNAVFNGNGGAWKDFTADEKWSGTNTDDDAATIEIVTGKFNYEAEITAPISNPVREGHYLDPDMPWGTELGIMDIEDVSFDANWIKESYTVNWVNNGQVVKTETVAYDAALTAPEVSKVGYTVKGWFDSKGNEAPAAMNDIGADGAIVTYTVEFTPDAGGVDYRVNIYLMDTDGSYASAPTRTDTEHEVADTEVTYNKTIDGFTLDTTKGNLTAVIAGDGSTVLNAYYARNKVTVDINGDVDEYFQGEEVDLPDAPAKEGETFEKWVDENGNTVSDPYTVPNEEDKAVTLTPVYTKNTYKATFIIAAEGVSNTYTTTDAKYEDDVVVPAVPAEADLPTGYTFVGWAKTEGATEALDDLGTMPVSGVTFYAVLAGKTTIAYNIEKYFMETDGVTYKLDTAKSETKTDGTAGVEKTITADTYEGFTFDADNANNQLTAVIKGDGTTTFKVYYNRNTVKVTINGEEEDKFYGEEIQTPENVPEDKVPEGNKQDGWVDGNGDPVEFPVTVGTDPIVIEPNFVPDDFLMTFMNGDATVQSGDQTYGEKLTVPADQVLAGHSFDGWFDADGNKVVAGTTTVPSKATTYTAKFTPVNYKVNFVADGQTIKTGEYAFGTKVSTLVPDYTAPAGFTFEGWSTDGSTVIEFTDDVTVPVDGVTYYAVLKAASGVKYTIKTYLQNIGGAGYTPQADEEAYGTTGEEITYVPADKEGFTLDTAQSKLIIDALAGDGSSVIRVFYNRNTVKVTVDGEEDTYYYDDVIEKEDPTPEDGYTFDKWVDGEGNTVTFPMNVPAEDIVIEPVFTPIKYAVTFTVNGAEYATGMYDYKSDIVAPEDDPTVAGYTFEGWSTDGKTVLDDLGQVALNGNTFQAVLTPNAGINYTVKKVFQNADGSAWNEPVDDVRKGTAGDTVALKAADEAVDGFSVYNIDPATTTIAGDGSTVIYIYYTRNKVSVTINGEKNDYYYETEIEEPTDVEKDGYDFKGWVDEDGNTVTFPIKVPAEDTVITPVYEAQTKSLSFEIDGVTVEGYPITAKVDSDIAAPADPEKDGYSFVGWFIKGTSTAFDGKMPTADTVYEAKWTAGTNTMYTIDIYMMDTNGQYSMVTSTVSYGVTGTLAEIVPNDAALAGFTHDASLSELSKLIDADGSTVLKIYYARDLYTVTWIVDGLETEDEVYFGAAIEAPADPEKTGYTFAGWTPDVPATMPANDVEFTATWAEAEYTITYVVDGAKTTETYKYGDTVTVKAAPSAEGMTFDGWFDGATEYVAGSTFTMPAKDLIIVADFSVGVYKVTYLDANGAVFTTEMVKFGDEIPVPAEAPTKEYHVFKGWEINYDSMPAEDIVVAPIFERIPVKLIPMAGSTTIIDRDNMVIYGLQEYLNENILLNNYLDVEGDGYIVITPVQAGYYGTGAKVELYDNLDTSAPVETFTIVVFGDINGDSLVQAIDSTYADDENLMLTTWSQKQIFDGSAIVANPDYDPYKTMAADLNGDGIIDSTDATIIGDATIGIEIIDQVTGRTA